LALLREGLRPTCDCAPKGAVNSFDDLDPPAVPELFRPRDCIPSLFLATKVLFEAPPSAAIDTDPRCLLESLSRSGLTAGFEAAGAACSLIASVRADSAGSPAFTGLSGVFAGSFAGVSGLIEVRRLEPEVEVGLVMMICLLELKFGNEHRVAAHAT
jgi:hypothetical protein